MPPYKDKTAYAVQRIDKDMQRKREQEFGWEDITDSAFMPLPQPLQSRFWRTPERLYRYSEGRKPVEVITFDHYNTPFIQIVGQRYRKRIGRGGRIHLDRLASCRILPSQSSDEEGGDAEEKLERMKERWRYDADVPQELPSTRFPMVLDDFDTKFAATRSRMLPVSDWESVYPASSHVEEALLWTMREPDRPPPMQVIGKLPGQRIHAFAQPLNGVGMQGQQSQQQQYPHSQQQQQQQPQQQPQQLQQHQQQQALGGQMAAAAAAVAAANANGTRPMGVGVQQPSVGGGANRRASGVAGGGVGGKNTPQPASGGGGGGPPLASPSLPQQPQIRRLMWENGS